MNTPIYYKLSEIPTDYVYEEEIPVLPAEPTEAELDDNRLAVQRRRLERWQIILRSREIAARRS